MGVRAATSSKRARGAFGDKEGQQDFSTFRTPKTNCPPSNSGSRRTRQKRKRLLNAARFKPERRPSRTRRHELREGAFLGDYKKSLKKGCSRGRSRGSWGGSPKIIKPYTPRPSPSQDCHLRSRAQAPSGWNGFSRPRPPVKECQGLTGPGEPGRAEPAPDPLMRKGTIPQSIT